MRRNPPQRRTGCFGCPAAQKPQSSLAKVHDLTVHQGWIVQLGSNIQELYESGGQPSRSQEGRSLLPAAYFAGAEVAASPFLSEHATAACFAKNTTTTTSAGPQCNTSFRASETLEAAAPPGGRASARAGWWLPAQIRRSRSRPCCARHPPPAPPDQGSQAHRIS